MRLLFVERKHPHAGQNLQQKILKKLPLYVNWCLVCLIWGKSDKFSYGVFFQQKISYMTLFLFLLGDVEKFDLKVSHKKSHILFVYSDQLLGAARTQNLVETYIQPKKDNFGYPLSLKELTSFCMSTSFEE